MEKERKITAPEGCEIEKVEIVDGVAVVTFREKELEIPETWEEFCEMYPIKDGECFIGVSSNIVEVYKSKGDRCPKEDGKVLPDCDTAEAVLALCQLIQLRNCYNGDWMADWTNNHQTKHVIYFEREDVIKGEWTISSEILYFKTAELRDQFLHNFRPLIEKLKPLYGLK